MLVLHPMKKLFLLLILLPNFVLAQERITLKGNIFDGLTFFPINEANIYNFSSKKYSFTNKEGNFEILVMKGDTIIVSKPAYKQVLIEITQEIIEKKMLEVSLFYKAIILKEVSVYAFPATYKDFKREFVGTNFSDYYKMLQESTLSQEDRDRIKYSKPVNHLDLIPGKVGEAVRSPITALYNAFSKKMKMERLYKELVDNQEEVEKLPLKYNRELVTSLTGLEGEELLNFMTFCKFSYYDLVRWTPELIISQIQKKYGDYEYFKALEDN